MLALLTHVSRLPRPRRPQKGEQMEYYMNGIWNMDYHINQYDHPGGWFGINCWLPLTGRSSGFIGHNSVSN